MATHPIDTPRLLIRPFEPGDWPAVFAYTSDPQVMTWIPEGVFDEAMARAFVGKNAGEDGIARAVILKATGQLIGHIVFHPWFSARIHEIGWVFHPAHHGQGYATEAARAMLAHGFETLNCHRIVATCQPENPASYRVMEKLGMRREGHFRECIERPGGAWWDEYFYAILQTEWLGLSH